MKHLRGRNVLITGAGGGIGRHVADAFARAGASLVLPDISEEATEAVLSAVAARGACA